MAEKLNACRGSGILRKKIWNKRSALRLSEGHWLSLALSGSGALLPQGCLNDCAAAACVSQWVVLLMGKNSGHILGLAGLAEGDSIVLLWVS